MQVKTPASACVGWGMRLWMMMGNTCSGGKEMYDISVRTIYRLIAEGELQPSQPGASRSKNFINKQDFLDMMEKNRVVKKPIDKKKE